MLCRKFRQTLFAKSAFKNNVQYQCLITSRFFSKRCNIFDKLLSTACKSDRHLSMSTFRLVLKDLRVSRLWSAWTRSFIVNTVVKRCKRDRSVREVIQCFKQTILRPRRTLLLSATAAYKSRDEDSEVPPSCAQNITDEDLEALVTDLEGVEELSRTTLFCPGCGQRVIIDNKQVGVRYCVCKNVPPPEDSYDGWVPYMEAEDVIIWRKEYKPGQGLYAYKVYGRYKELNAQDFAAIQVDGGYRRVWDTAVADLSVVEREANGVSEQAVLHWEVLWPRLFANRDYVYIRRHKTFEVIKTPHLPHKDSIFNVPSPEPPPPQITEQPSVHSNAKRKSMENDLREKMQEGDSKENKVFIIISRSCEHPLVPVTKRAIRVTEYWSNMVVRTINGPEQPGMEFVLTYYDEPAVGGLPTGVASWATGRAAPVYLERMRKAAKEYTRYREEHPNLETPDFLSYKHSPPVEPVSDIRLPSLPENEMESSKLGPDLENGCSENTREQSTQTELEKTSKPSQTNEQADTQPRKDPSKIKAGDMVSLMKKEKNISDKESPAKEGDSNKPEEEENNGTNGSWWRYMYPFYYFV